MNQKQIEEIQASVNEAIGQARLKVEELLKAIDGALAVGTFVDLGEIRSEAQRALQTLPRGAKLYDPAVVITCQWEGVREYRGGSKDDRRRCAQAFADACNKILGAPALVVEEVHDEHRVRYERRLDDLNDAQVDLIRAALTQRGLFVED